MLEVLQYILAVEYSSVYAFRIDKDGDLESGERAQKRRFRRLTVIRFAQSWVFMKATPSLCVVEIEVGLHTNWNDEHVATVFNELSSQSLARATII